MNMNAGEQMLLKRKRKLQNDCGRMCYEGIF